MEPQDPNVAMLTSVVAACAMVALGMARRRLVWRRTCRVCGGPHGLCRCRLPRW